MKAKNFSTQSFFRWLLKACAGTALALAVFVSNAYSFLPVQAAQLTFVRDVISTSAPATPAVHDIFFTTNKNIPALGSFAVTFQSGKFFIPGDLNFNDISVYVNGVSIDVAALPGTGSGSAFGAAVTPGINGSIKISLNSADSIAAKSSVEVKIGSPSVAAHCIVNPAAMSSYKINIQTFNSDNAVIDDADTMIATVLPVGMGNSPGSVAPSSTPPVISSFTAFPAVINSGNSAVLSWEIFGAEEVKIEPGLGRQADTESGSVLVSPFETTAYTITAINSFGSASSTVTVAVNSLPPSGSGGGAGGAVFLNKAKFYITPFAGKFFVGDIVKAAVKIDSGSGSATAGSAVLNYPKDLIKVMNLTKANLFSSWSVEPKFDNDTGTITFSGSSNSGFYGADNTVLGITFEIIAPGAINLNFRQAKILNGNADTYGGFTGAVWNASASEIILPPPVVPTTTPSLPSLPLAPTVSSPTHPNQRLWYSNNNPVFNWKLPKGVMEVSFSLDDKEYAEPANNSPALQPSVSYSNVSDGVKYFHIKFRNNKGWGPTAIYRIQVDTTAPKPFVILFPEGDKTANTQPKAFFKAEDETSGIDRYEWQIGDDLWTTPQQTNDGLYQLPPQKEGVKNIKVRAYDRAGNFTESKAVLTILAVQPAISQLECSPVSYLFAWFIWILLALIIAILLLMIIATFKAGKEDKRNI